MKFTTFVKEAMEQKIFNNQKLGIFYDEEEVDGQHGIFKIGDIEKYHPNLLIHPKDLTISFKNGKIQMNSIKDIIMIANGNKMIYQPLEYNVWQSMEFIIDSFNLNIKINVDIGSHYKHTDIGSQNLLTFDIDLYYIKGITGIVEIVDLIENKNKTYEIIDRLTNLPSIEDKLLRLGDKYADWGPH